LKLDNLPALIQDELVKLPEGLLSHIDRARSVGKEISTMHGIDFHNVDLAIAAHDLAKHLTEIELINECKKMCVDMNCDYLLVPKLLHGPVAASWLKNKFDVLDESIIEAVRYHTTGYPGMGTVSKVVFLADKLDGEKIKRNPELEKVLSLSVSDLDAAVLAYMDMLIKSLIEQNFIIHPYSIACRNHLLKKYLDSN
jgi:predicted HD superfamily hydrolase involved in NAD metabolism